MKKKNDMVNNPSHYAGGTSLECIDSMLAVLGVRGTIDFCLGNSYKYLWRHKLKGKPEEDLEKAQWYVDRAVILNNSYLFDTDIDDKTQALGGLCQLYRCVYDGNKALHTRKEYSDYSSDYTRKKYSDYYKGPKEKKENKEEVIDAVLTTEDTHKILDCLENLANGIDDVDYNDNDILKDIARIINAIDKGRGRIPDC